jgi:peptidoglycan/xylan/chitin deacetylase (PgdA/CDA1 family)
MALTIVMYHYVRDLARTRYPAIKGRDLSSFRRQMDYIAKHYTVITAEQAIGALTGGEPLPDDAAWLTFDDGYIDHYSMVFPILHERHWQGSFFPPVRSVRDRELLDVNRVHFILAASPNPELIVAAIRKFVENVKGREGTHSFDEYWAELAVASRMDPAEVVFIKRILQHGLPLALRGELAKKLFEQFVSVDPAAFAAELYMTPDQLKTMISCGMYVGSHGAGHFWLDRLNAASQVNEVDTSLEFLGSLGARTKKWVMSYPYGAYNEALLSLLKDRDCALGLATRVGVAQPGTDDPLVLPRLDTNDLPA